MEEKKYIENMLALLQQGNASKIMSLANDNPVVANMKENEAKSYLERYNAYSKQIGRALLSKAFDELDQINQEQENLANELVIRLKLQQ